MRHDARAERADRRLRERGVQAGDDVVTEVEHQVEVVGPPEPVRHAVQDLLDPTRPFATRRALAARLVGEELRQPPRDEQRVGGLVEHHDRSRPEHGLEVVLHVVHVGGLVEMLGHQPRRRRAARDEELHAAPAGHSPGEALDELAERRTELDLVVGGPLDVARHGEDARARRPADPEPGVPVAAAFDDGRDRGQRLDVVDHRRLGEETLHRRERRLDARHRPLALEARQQAGLVAGDVAARAAVEDHVEIEARSEDVPAQEPALVRLVDGAPEPLVSQCELAPDVHERLMALDGERGDHDALDQLVRVSLDEHVVLERGRLALVGVHGEVARVHVLGQERPLLAGAEPGASSAPQTRRLHLLVLDRLGAHPERLPQRLVAAGRQVPLERPRVFGVVAEPLGDDAGLGHQRVASAPTRVPETVRGVRLPRL